MRKWKRFTSVFTLLLVASLLAGNAETRANSSDSNHYTYVYDCWGVDRESPDAYSVERVISGSDFAECGNFSEPQGIYSIGNRMYVVDTGNNRICEFTYENSKFTYVKDVKGYKDAEGNDLYTATVEPGWSGNAAAVADLYKGPQFQTESKTGYTDKVFAGWVDSKGDPINIASIDGNTFVYASFNGGELIEYSVSYKVDGKTETVTYTVEDTEAIDLPEPEKDGYTFNGWTAEGLDAPIKAIEPGTTELGEGKTSLELSPDFTVI